MSQKIDFVVPEGVIATAVLEDGRVTIHGFNDEGRKIAEHISKQAIGPPRGPMVTIEDGEAFFKELPHRYSGQGFYATKPRAA